MSRENMPMSDTTRDGLMLFATAQAVEHMRSAFKDVYGYYPDDADALRDLCADKTGIAVRYLRDQGERLCEPTPEALRLLSMWWLGLGVEAKRNAAQITELQNTVAAQSAYIHKIEEKVNSYASH